MKRLCSFLCFLLLSACEPAKDDLLVVGTSADNPPYEFIHDNKITGFDIDIANAIGEKLNKKIVIKNLEFNGLIAALNSKNIDFIIAGLSITPQREANVEFSIPYFETKIAILYRLSDDLQNLEDLNNKIIGVQLGTIWEELAYELGEKYHFKSSSLSNNLMLLEELKSKVIDAIIMEEAQVKRLIANHKEFKYLLLEDIKFEFAIGLPKNSSLKQEIDKALENLKTEGKLKNIKQKWQLH